MTDLILHHHDPSPYAEKIRRLFGLKKLAWRSVQIPMVMPKPDLTLLTGGYRGTPVLQIGADVYCDSRLIAEVVEAVSPNPEALTTRKGTHSAIQHLSDDILFPMGAALALYENREILPKEVSDDRRDYFQNIDFEQFEQNADYFRDQLMLQLTAINDQLARSAGYISAPYCTWDDMNIWMVTWMLETNVQSLVPAMEALTALSEWRFRMAALGTGERSDIMAPEAHALAKGSEPQFAHLSANAEVTDIAPGSAVTICPADHMGDTIGGRLLRVTGQAYSIERETDELGKVAVHFPRIGYRLTVG